MELLSILRQAVTDDASDILLIVGRPVSFRKRACVRPAGEERIMPQDGDDLLQQMYRLAGDRSLTQLKETGDDSFSFAVPGLSRFRVSAYKQRGSLSAAIRVIPFGLPDFSIFNIPDEVLSIGDLRSGLVLIGGSFGSGRSTTLAGIIDHINHTQARYILTLEDPLEYLHRHDLSVISQREIGIDTKDYHSAVTSAIKQSPDVLLIDHLPDKETISAVLHAVEAGCLVLAACYGTTVKAIIQKLINKFPEKEQSAACDQLADALELVTAQRLGVDGTIEVSTLSVNHAVRQAIRNQEFEKLLSM